MLDLHLDLGAAPGTRGQAPWPGHEYVKGWGVFGQPFATGHVLALRVVRENDFGSYRTLWHRDPEGAWSIYVDGPRLDTACPRYYGAACNYTGFGRLDLEWLGPATLRVRLDALDLDWVLTAVQTPLLRILNVVNDAVPLSAWRHPAMLHARERMARTLGMGGLRLRGVMPSGHVGTLMPQRMYLINDTAATLNGMDLGPPARLRDNPTIGDFPLPARGVLAVGQGVWEILDPREYDLTRAETSIHS
jgi:hypothetical protein